MKVIRLEAATLNTCIEDAQHERLVITRDGKPVALVIGVEGMDEEQVQLGSSEKFWKLIQERRAHKTLSRGELEEKIDRGPA